MHITSEQVLLDSLREALGFDFAGFAPVPDAISPELMWTHASGNTNKRFERIVLPPGVGVMGIVYRSKCPLIVEDVSRDIPRRDQYQYPIVAAEGLVSFFALPLVKENTLKAILLCAYRTAHPISEEMLKATVAFLAEATDFRVPSLNRPVRPSNAMEEITYDDTTHKVLQAQEEERRRISRELHDGIAQEILLAQIELRKLKYLPPEEQLEGIEKSSEYLRQIMKHVSAMAIGLRPTQLDELGLGPAIKAYGVMLQDTYGVEVKVEVDHSIKLTSDQETAFYRIAQEALSNACKYSRTELIEVMLRRQEKGIQLAIRDYGLGFDVEYPRIYGSGLGLIDMQERAELVGGEFKITSSPETGTLIQVWLPVSDLLVSYP